MLGFLRDGGWPMWPVLFLGVISIATALRDSMLATETSASTKRLVLATIGAAIGGTLLDMRTVLLLARQIDESTLYLGLGESLAPVVLGFALFAIGQVVLAVAPARRLSA